MTTVIETRELSKTYGILRALDNFSLSINQGEIFGLLGHNGAGKSTAIECMLGTRKPNSGTTRILGMDPFHDRKKIFCKVIFQGNQRRTINFFS